MFNKHAYNIQTNPNGSIKRNTFLYLSCRYYRHNVNNLLTESEGSTGKYPTEILL
jgi:hypothetical protein